MDRRRSRTGIGQNFTDVSVALPIPVVYLQACIYGSSPGQSSAALWGRETESQEMPSPSSGQSGHRQGWESCQPSHQQVSQAAAFLNSEANRQRGRVCLTGGVEEISSNKRKKSHLRFHSPEEANSLGHSTTIAAYAISSASYPRDR